MVNSGTCSACKQSVWYGTTGGMDFVMNLLPVDVTTEITCVAYGVQMFEMNNPRTAGGLRVTARQVKQAGTGSSGTIHAAHRCKAKVIPPQKAVQPRARTYPVNSVTGMPLDGLPMYPPDWKLAVPPF